MKKAVEIHCPNSDNHDVNPVDLCASNEYMLAAYNCRTCKVSFIVAIDKNLQAKYVEFTQLAENSAVDSQLP